MLIDYQTHVDDLVRDDDSRITPADRDLALQLAVRRYSKDRPRVLVEDVAGDGTKLLSLPSAWVTDFSDVQSIEYPIGNVPPTLLEQHELYQAPASTKIMLATVIPSGSDARVRYTATRALGATENQIPDQDMEPVCAWAASVLCDQLASLYAGDVDSTIAADSVDRGTKAGEFARRARDFRKRYFDELGIDPRRSAPAGVFVDLDRLSSRGRGRLTHPERYR